MPASGKERRRREGVVNGGDRGQGGEEVGYGLCMLVTLSWFGLGRVWAAELETRRERATRAVASSAAAAEDLPGLNFV